MNVFSSNTQDVNYINDIRFDQHFNLDDKCNVGVFIILGNDNFILCVQNNNNVNTQVLMINFLNWCMCGPDSMSCLSWV